MKKLAALLLSALFLLPLTACRTKEIASRAETVQERYAALTSYTAAAAVELADEEENVRYTLRFDADAEETKVTVLAPELLAGVTAHLAADTLKLEYDGLVLDAGGTPGGVSAVTCVPLALRAAGEGWLTERSEEEIEYGGGTVRALRLCFESEAGGETIQCTLWFGADDAPLKEVLLELLHEPSIYCRENAMQALYTAGDPAVLVRALRIIDASSLYYHSKLLSDGLLNYTGDTWELADALWEAFDAFQPWMQVTLLNYFRFSSGAYCEKIHALLNDGARDDEVRFSCLRYLGHYPYPPAYADLLRYATPSENARWEYAAIASSVLASYPGAETAAVLERNLYHPNWYIRFNASKSLEQLGFGYRDLIDVIEGHDRYASEILRYRFDVRELEERKEDAVCTTV